MTNLAECLKAIDQVLYALQFRHYSRANVDFYFREAIRWLRWASMEDKDGN